MGELAGDKYSIQKRATRCILPRKRPRDRIRTLSSNPISTEIQAFQRGADQTVKKRAEEEKWTSKWAINAAFESVQRAASYLGSAAAIAFAPSTPILLYLMSRSVRGALTK